MAKTAKESINPDIVKLGDVKIGEGVNYFFELDVNGNGVGRARFFKKGKLVASYSYLVRLSMFGPRYGNAVTASNRSVGAGDWQYPDRVIIDNPESIAKITYP